MAFVGLLMVVTLIAIMALFTQRLELKSKLSNLEKEKNNLLSKLSNLEKEKNNLLSKIEELKKELGQKKEIPIEEHWLWKSKMREHEQEISNLKKTHKEELKNALNELKAEFKSKKSGIEAEQMIADAIANAERILSEARLHASIIVGETYTPYKDLKTLENSLLAIKNTIDGYGSSYIVPTFNFIDELAETYGFTDAGKSLKIVREQIRVMIKNRLAGRCEYADTERKEKAIDFVVDSFNGKVDSILSSAKEENYGILAQKIKDAYELVNLNGLAFRKSCISEIYLNARLEELKNIVVLNELKQREREEQRAIKERMREEERARKEYERAKKEAEREEEMLKKALEKAQREVDKASEAQKAEYEGRVADLMEKLKQAEEKNQRAISMAQQTKAGNVYIISNVGSFGENVYKIGMTRRLEPLERVKELGDASVPFEFDVHALIYTEDAPKLENELHKRFIQMQVNKVNPRKEFFRLKIDDIKNVVDSLGIEARWTLSAEAKEYRESLAIEQNVFGDEAKKAEWLKHQLEVVPTQNDEEEPLEN